MVVLAVAICQPNGKPILSRQFIEMSRFRIEGLLDSFAKLLSGGRKQHTFFETEAVRYVYQPLDELYLLVLTNKGSNIGAFPPPTPSFHPLVSLAPARGV